MFSEASFLNLVYYALIFVMGALAASSFIIEKQPNAKETLSKLVPYKGGIGIAALIWSFLRLLGFIFSGGFGALFSFLPLLSICYLIVMITGIVGGFVLGYQILHKNLFSENKEATSRGKSIYKSLTEYEKRIGLAAMISTAVLTFFVLIGASI